MATADSPQTSYSILWLDAAANIGEDNRHAQEQLRSIINHLKTFEDEYKFQKYIESVASHKQLILIVSGQLGKKVVPHIHHMPQISSIYVYCMDQKRNELWAKNYSKIKAVYIRMDDLISHIKSEQSSHGQLNEPIAITFYSPNDGSDKSTTGLNGDFVQNLLLIDVLLRMKSVESDKKQLISKFRNMYQDEDSIDIIDEFEEDYASKDALEWYTCESFLYKMLNHALRTQDIDMLFLFRFFIRDIYEQLKRNQCSSPVRVYRGQKLSIDEVNNLQRSVDDFISINSFFSTSINRNKALEFIGDADISNDVQRVLFEIEAHPCVVTTKPFANISPFSKYQAEREILFMIGSIFRVENVRQNNNQTWIIQMRLCSDDNYHLKELFVYMKKTYADSNKEITLLSFGRVLHQMGKYDLAEKVYKRLLEELSSDDPSRSDLFYSLGIINMNKGDYDACIQQFEKVLKIKFQADSPDYIYIGGIYNAIGEVYRNKEDYNQALESYNKAIDLYKKAHAENHLDMAYSYNNIGLVYQEKEKYLEALNYYEKSLAIKGKCLPPTHPSIGTAHNNIGLIHHSLKYYDAALNHYKQSLDIQLKSLPTQHPDIAMSYENMGYVYEDQRNWNQALTYFKSAQSIYEKSLAPQHPDTIKNKKDIQRVTAKLK